MTSPRRSTCPINASLEVLGDRWTLLIIRDMLFGQAQTYRDFLASDEGIATNILADRLKRLLDQQIITGTRDPQDARRTVYRLTEKGMDLVPVLMELSRWGTRYQGCAPPPGILAAWVADPQAFIAALRDRLPTPPTA